jgi:3-oxoacyl-[acyl-carrier-protein] synthase-3
MTRGAHITGFGHFVPEKIVTNADIIDRGINTSDEWIVTRTGIRERRIAADTEQSSDLALHAAQMALKTNSFSNTDLDLIIVATSTPNFKGFPSTANILQHQLGAPVTCAAFDLSAACTGFSYALTTACQYIYSGQADHVLVVGVDCLSKIIDWEDRSTCILFGDGAGAALLGPASQHHILGSKLYSDGSLADILKVTDYIKMEGRAVFKAVVSKVVPAIDTFLAQHSLSVSDITYFVPHQANRRIIEVIQEKMGFTDSQTLENISKYGNTSSASIPIALSEAYHANRFKPGDLILTVGFGAGFTWGITLIKWSDL